MNKVPNVITTSGFLLAALLMFGQQSVLYAQTGNLVVNPSFEKEIDFQNPPSDNKWSKCLKNDTPDYITFTERGEPDFYYRKYIGGLLPFDGNAYVGIFCFRIHPLNGIDNVREFIQAPLSQTLQKDTLYRVSFHVALDPESNTAINSFNAFLSGELISKKREKEMYELKPRIRFEPKYYDSSSWMKLEAEYKARGYESRIVIGNFSKDKSTGKKRVSFESEMQPKWNMHELERVAYYYVDMVSVEKLPETITPPDVLPARPEIQPEPVEDPDTAFLEIARVRHDSSIVLNHIYFAFDESNLLPESYKELDILFEQLNKHRELSIIIEGHTDNLGTYEYNIKLSLERAMAVASYLKGKGVATNRISYEGLGYTRPLSDNRTEEGRQLNRRVAFRINEARQIQKD